MYDIYSALNSKSIITCSLEDFKIMKFYLKYSYIVKQKGTYQAG